jgi:hypothetical protein
VKRVQNILDPIDSILKWAFPIYPAHAIQPVICFTFHYLRVTWFPDSNSFPDLISHYVAEFFIIVLCILIPITPQL